jgi:hypothetical protein
MAFQNSNLLLLARELVQVSTSMSPNPLSSFGDRIPTTRLEDQQCNFYLFTIQRSIRADSHFSTVSCHF